ncbi:MAG: tetratricopeptide repeat protein [Candidatus Acidiferrales bacterium]
MFSCSGSNRDSQSWRNCSGDPPDAGAFRLGVLVLFCLLVAAASFAPVQAQTQPQTQTRTEHATALIEQGRAQAAAGKFPDALASYQEVLRLEPHNLKAEIGMAQAYRGVRNFDEAKKILEQAHRGHPRSAAPLAVYGDLDIQLQTYEAAIAHLNAALALDPADVDARNRLAVAYKAKGDAPSALAQLAKILARDPKNALAHYTRADIYADHNQDAQALVDAEKVVELQPENPLGRMLLAKILVRPPEKPAPGDIKERCTKAVDALEPLVGAGPGTDAASPPAAPDSETLFLLSRAYRCAGQDDKAQQTLVAFEKSSQNDRTTAEDKLQAKHLVQQADDLAIKNDFAGSLALLNQAIALDPTYAATYSQLAKLYYSAGEISKASDAIGQALAREPYHPEYLYVQGKILERESRLDDALAAFQESARVNPKESDAYFEIGAIYQQRGDRASALAAYKKAIEISPDDPDYKRALASLNSNPPPTP